MTAMIWVGGSNGCHLIKMSVVHKIFAGDIHKSQATLPLNLIFTGARTWSSKSIRENNEFLTLWHEVASTFSQADISLKVIKFLDAEINAGDLPAIFEALEKQGSKEALNIIFATWATTSVGGVSYGLPGPAFTDLKQSGVLVIAEHKSPFDIPGLQAPQTSIESLAIVLGHEMAHYLGLYHTRTRDSLGNIFGDPLSDTDDSAHNMMFFSPGASSRQISAQQKMVMRLHPLVQLTQ